MTDRFRIAQDGPPATEAQLEAHAAIAIEVRTTAQLLEALTAPSREQSLALTKLEEALMWAGKAIFQEAQP